MTVVVGTGTFAVVSDEIDWLIHPELRASSGTERVSWGQLEQSALTHAPGHLLTSLSANEGSYFTIKATMVNPNGRRYFLYIDPYTAEVTGTTGTLTVQRFLRDLHRYLFLPNIIGLPVVTTMAVVLMISLYTGLKTARNWRTLATRVRFNKGARVATGDFHKAAGLWGIWFFVIIIATSFWYFAELISAVAGAHFEPSRPGVSQEQAATYGKVARLADADTLATAATDAFPGLRITSMNFSLRATQAATVLGRYTDPLVRQRANRVFLNPMDASIIHVQKDDDLSTSAYLNELADPLHFGSFGGLTTKLIWFIFGLAMLSLTLTGVWLTWKRVKSRSPTRAQWANVPLLVFVGFIAVPYVQNHTSTNSLNSPISLGTQITEDYTAELFLDQTDNAEFNGTLRLLLKNDQQRINLDEVTFNAKNYPDAESSKKPFLIGKIVAVDTTMPTQMLSQGDLEFEATLKFVSGEAETHTFQFKRELLVSTDR